MEWYSDEHSSRLNFQTARHLVRQCCLCEADWEELHWALFHCGSCFPLRVFASMMIEQNHPDHGRKRSSSLRPARVRKGRGSHRVKGCMLKTRSFQHVPCVGQPCHAGHCYATRCVKGTSLDVVEILPSLDAWTNTWRKTKMEPENAHWEKETSLQTIHFRIPCWFLVFFFCPELLGNKLKLKALPTRLHLSLLGTLRSHHVFSVFYQHAWKVHFHNFFEPRSSWRILV